ncbi:hypothetical protein C0J52_22182 [Blattella germanica]|nr:hypothetical protein C0J52_27170 [Blattella germanica]PSN30717.1 hypothetical protein C0J52_22182 [Blattella germanica]
MNEVNCSFKSFFIRVSLYYKMMRHTFTTLLTLILMVAYVISVKELDDSHGKSQENYDMFKEIKDRKDKMKIKISTFEFKNSHNAATTQILKDFHAHCNQKCKEGEECYFLSNEDCTHDKCSKVPKCRPKGHVTCENVICKGHENCIMKQVKDSKGNIFQVPKCQPSGKETTCDDVICKLGKTCYMEKLF